MIRKTWIDMWNGLGASDDGMGHFDWLCSLYAEPHRRYHTMRHVAHCLREFDIVRCLCARPYVVQCALFFHDAVYDTQATDNEERSAELASSVLRDANVASDVRVQVERLILATAHTEADLVRADEQLIVDVDLAILGQQPDDFDRYEHQIRAEYAWVPEDVFRVRRADILRHFLDKTRIYHSEALFARYEKQARMNLAVSLDRLK